VKTKCHRLYLVDISFLLIGLLSLLMCVLFWLGHFLRLSFLLLCGLFFNGCLLLGWLLLCWLLLRRLFFDLFCFLCSNRLLDLSRLLIWLFHSHFRADFFLRVNLRDHVIRFFSSRGNIIIE
jgi:hypothetical protein